MWSGALKEAAADPASQAAARVYAEALHATGDAEKARLASLEAIHRVIRNPEDSTYSRLLIQHKA